MLKFPCVQSSHNFIKISLGCQWLKRWCNLSVPSVSVQNVSLRCRNPYAIKRLSAVKKGQRDEEVCLIHSSEPLLVMTGIHLWERQHRGCCSGLALMSFPQDTVTLCPADLLQIFFSLVDY